MSSIYDLMEVPGTGMASWNQVLLQQEPIAMTPSRVRLDIFLVLQITVFYLLNYFDVNVPLLCNGHHYYTFFY
jgi:hypothetical protein